MKNNIEYWNLIKEAGSYNNKWSNILETKTEIFKSLLISLNPAAKSVLFAGFSPIAVALGNYYEVYVNCNDQFSNFWSNINIVNLDSIDQKFDFVFAIDEHLTYFACEADQRQQTSKLASLTNGWFITTLQDYKNFAPHKRNQIEPLMIQGSNNYIMLENNLVDKADKQSWYYYWYCIKNHNEFMNFGPIPRRTMYFKQLAKYLSDAGSSQYVIQKNLLYKGFFNRYFEHIITAKF